MHYVYIVYRPEGYPLYVGKGSGARLERHDRRAKSNCHYANVLKKSGEFLPTTVVACNLKEDEAYLLEESLTRFFGIESEGGTLVNCGHGGRGGPLGIKKSKEWKAIRRQRAIEVWQRAEYRTKILREDRKRSGNKQPRSDAFKLVVSTSMMGNTHTLGFRHSEESKALMSKKRKGVSKSLETRAKMREGAKRGWLKRKRYAPL